MASKYRIIPEDYTSALSVGHEFRLEFTSFERESEAAFLRLLRRFLTKCDMLFLNDVLITIMKELITNAVKANAKRLYFEKRGLDIRNSQDYAEGMKTFKSEGLRSGSEILTDLELTDYIVKIFFRCTENSMTIAVANNIEMVPEENAKMNARIEKAYSYDDITQAFAENLDDSEGAGLGLIMAMMIYKNAGFSREDFTITSLSGVTTCSLKFAPRKDYREFQNKITDEITQAIEAIPSLPENIVQLQSICEDENIAMKEVSDFIKRDPGLAASILKLANSAGYITSKRIRTLDEAVILIGLKGIKSIALASAIDGIINTRFREFKSIWDESFQRAFYAYKIAIQLKNPIIAENVYLAALLSKLGRIILLSLKKEVMEKISSISGKRLETDTEILEEMALGISQTKLAAMIIRKWKFDDTLAAIIEFSKKPEIAPDACREEVYIVYLASFMVNVEKKQYHFSSADEDVLEYFNIANETNFAKLHEILINAYRKQSANTLNL